MSYHWTPSEEARLKHLLLTTKMSATEIGAEMGRSRGSIIGKCFRDGIALNNGNPLKANKRARRKLDLVVPRYNKPLRGGPDTRDTAYFCPKALKRKRKPQVIPTKAEPAPCVEVITDSVPRCHWPVGDQEPGPDLIYCGARLPNHQDRKGLARSYCDEHLAISAGRVPDEQE